MNSEKSVANGHQTCKTGNSEGSVDDLAKVIVKICRKKISELCKHKNISESVALECITIGARELPPPSTVGSSCVYVMLRPDKRFYVGQTNDLEGRIRAHRENEGLQGSSFLYLVVPDKSLACQLETLLINQLHEHGFSLANLADGKHRNFGTSSSFMSDIVSIS